MLQTRTTTSADRYPVLFDRLGELLSPIESPRVLSFGCSSGEEVRSLRSRLPHAAVVGVDVNPRALARARRKDRDPRSCYLIGDRPPPGEPFDAILALGVFRHGELQRDRPPSCADTLPFAKAAEAVARLDAALRPGGWMAIANAQFRAADLLPEGRYERDAMPFKAPRVRTLYDRDNRLIDSGDERGGLFRKRA